MRTYHCTCGNRIYFENSFCLVCQKELGWCEACARMTSLEPAADRLPTDQLARPLAADYFCGLADCRQPLRKCHNYAVENVCNRCYSVTADAVPKIGAENTASPPANRLCTACQLTETIPDLTVLGNREKWARLEAAKRRLLYSLDRLGLPYVESQPRLSFDFKADVDPPYNEWRSAGPAEIVCTGHVDGKITINIREADDALREKMRVEFHEAHRTLIGHFHHEIGHYYWDALVRGTRENEFCRLFGDHKAVPYADAMRAYYQNGPPVGWPQSYISAYAAAHPWEDFAETFALYLDMVSVLDTAAHLFKSVRANFRCRSVQQLVEHFQEVGILVNEFNRTVGLIDLVPEVVVPSVVAKLEFVHSLVKQAARQPQIMQPATSHSAHQPISLA